ncbi:MAG: hypothetical protein WDO73_21390 [Ignavibacteriota bacterium]
MSMASRILQYSSNVSWMSAERAGLVLTKQALDQVHALAGELRVKLQAQVRFLCVADLVDFVGGQKIVLRGKRRG